MIWQLEIEIRVLLYMKNFVCLDPPTSMVTNRLPLHELLDTIEVHRISRHSLRILFSCKFRNISLYLLSRELNSCTSIWKARDNSPSFLKSACIVRNTVRFNSESGNFLTSIGSFGTFGASTGASYELNRCTIFAKLIRWEQQNCQFARSSMKSFNSIKNDDRNLLGLLALSICSL